MKIGRRSEEDCYFFLFVCCYKTEYVEYALQQIIIYDAVIRAKLMYGLESLQLNQNAQQSNLSLPTCLTKSYPQNPKTPKR